MTQPHMGRARTARRAFTLIEITITVVAMGILVALGMYGYQAVVNNVSGNTGRDALTALGSAEQSVYGSRGTFITKSADPADPWGELRELVSKSKYTYIDATAAPTQDQQISVVKGVNAAGVPYVAMATRVRDQCAMRAVFPATAQLPAAARVTPVDQLPGGVACSAIGAVDFLPVT